MSEDKDKGGHPLKWKTPEELEQKINEYFDWAKDNKYEYTVTGLAWFLGCSRTTINNYENSDENEWLKRLDSETKRKYVHSIKEAKRRIEMEYEQRLYDRSKAVGTIFALKNNYGWVDKQEIINKTSNEDDLGNLTEEELEQKLKEARSNK